MKQTITIIPNKKTIATLQKMISLQKEYRQIVMDKLKPNSQS